MVNIFGGIMRCDVIAMGVINAAQNIGMKKPIIVRLKGNHTPLYIDVKRIIVCLKGEFLDTHTCL
jgi:succinyl-CoA synthetase beta subunit